MAQINTEFTDKGVVRGGILLLQPHDALEMVRRCHEEGVAVLGVDGFRVQADSTQPVMEHSIDLSLQDEAGGGKADCWTRAELFLRERTDSGLLFEVVADE